MFDIRRGDLHEVVPGSLWSKHDRVVIVVARYDDDKKVKIVVLGTHGLRALPNESTFLWDYMYVMGVS